MASARKGGEAAQRGNASSSRMQPNPKANSTKVQQKGNSGELGSSTHLNDLQRALHVPPPVQHVQQVLGHRPADEQRALAEGVCGRAGRGGGALGRWLPCRQQAGGPKMPSKAARCSAHSGGREECMQAWAGGQMERRGGSRAAHLRCPPPGPAARSAAAWPCCGGRRAGGVGLPGERQGRAQGRPQQPSPARVAPGTVGGPRPCARPLPSASPLAPAHPPAHLITRPLLPSASSCSSSRITAGGEGGGGAAGAA